MPDLRVRISAPAIFGDSSERTISERFSHCHADTRIQQTVQKRIQKVLRNENENNVHSRERFLFKDN